MLVRYFLVWLIGCLYSLSVKADCQAPQSLSVYSITHQSASFSWYSNYYTNPPTYQLQWRVAGSTNWTINPVTTNTLSLTGLINNTTYEWRVRSICTAGDTSAYTNGSAFQTKCDLPAYLSVSNVTHESAQLSWSQPVSGATFELQWRPAGTATWSVVTNLTTGYYTLTGLTDQTPYEWQVRTICSSVITSDFVTGSIFQTRCLPPTNAQTSLINPDAVEVKWDSPFVNALYDLQWRPAGSSTWTLVTGITTNTYQITGLNNATDYVWQVRTACTTTSKSSFSDAQYFRTSCPLPTYLSTTYITYNTATLQWSSFASDLQWRASGAADWTTVPNARSPFNLTGLVNNTTYEWRVRTVCSPTATSAYTASQLFTTQCLAPTYAYTGSNSVGGFDIAWNAPDDGPFEVQWRVTGTTNWSVATGVIGNVYRLAGLMLQTSYDWRVRRACSTTDYSAFVTGPSVQVACSTPVYPYGGNATSSSIDLSWDYSTTGGRYELQWRPAGAVDWTTVTNINTYQYSLTGLQSAVSYEWRVRRICSSDVASAYTATQTFTLTCTQPGYLYAYTIDVSSATVSWYAASNNSPYEVQYRPLGMTTWISTPFITNSIYSLTGLANNTTYEWRVRATCSTGEAAFSAVQTFQTQCNLPSALAVPTVNYNSAQLTWTTNSNTKLYEIQYKESESTDWISIRPEGSETDPYFNAVGTNDTKRYTLYNLTPGKTYQWRVRTQCAASIYSDYSNGPSFTTTCATIQNISYSQQTNTSLQLSWYVLAVNGYELQWRAIGAQAWNTISGLTNTAYTLTGLTPGSGYEYRVRQQCAPDVVSDYSAIYSAKLICFPAYIASTQTLSASSVRVQWAYSIDNIDASTLNHELQYRIVGTQNWISVTGITGTTYSLTGLTTGTSYEARIRTLCTTDSQADFSNSFNFSANCVVPYPVYYNTPVSPTSAKLFWYASPSNTGPFLLQWRTAGSSTWTTVSIPYTLVSTTNAGTYTLTGLTNNTAYEWRVAATCGTDFLSDFSAIQSFMTTCPAVQSLYTESVGSTNARISWNNTTAASSVSYTIQYRPSGRVVWSELSGVTSMSASLTGLATNTVYEYRVRTECGSGYAAGFSYIGSFTTQCPSPAGISYTNLTPQSVQLVWTNSPNNAFVNLRWRQSNANTGWNVVAGLTGATYSLTGLMPSTYYEYQLQGVCSTDNQATNTSWSGIGFYTSALTALAIYTDSTAAQAVRLNWLNGPTRTNYILQWRTPGGAWNTSGPLATKRYLLTGLLVNTVYEVKLSYTDDNAVTYQATTTFTTTCSAPYYLRTYDIASNQARLTWTTVGIPSTLQWRVAGTTSWNTAPDLITGSYTLTGLTNNTTYEWRLLTSCTKDRTTAAYPVTFRTTCTMPTATNTQNISTEAAILAWTGAGSGYTLRYRLVGASDWTTLSNLTSTTLLLTGLTNNTTYEWAVGTVCEANVSTAFTSPLSFRTQCSLPYHPYVNRLAPDWAELSWSRSGPTSQLQWRVAGQTIWNNQPTVTSPYTLTGLTPGLTYEWRVRTTCLAEPDGAFVYGESFTPQCDFYYYTGLTQNVTPSSARLVWNATLPSLYGIRWRLIGSTTWNVVSGNITSPYLLTGLTNNTTYEWQIRSACQPNYGSSQVFQTHCNSPTNLQTDGLTDNAVTLRWNNPGDGVSYKIRWRVAGSSTWNSSLNITSTSYSLQGLTNATAYEWQVGSQCAADDSDFQLTASFKTVDPNACPQGMYTVKAGFWDDPTVWSCNRLPIVTDVVQIKHVITVQSNYVAKAFSIRYDPGGQLVIGTAVIIQTGN